MNLVLIAGFFLFNDYELYLDIMAVIVSFVWALIGWTAGRREHKKLCTIFLVFAFIQPSYVIFKMVQYGVFEKQTFEGWVEPLLYGVGNLKKKIGFFSTRFNSFFFRFFGFSCSCLFSYFNNSCIKKF